LSFVSRLRHRLAAAAALAACAAALACAGAPPPEAPAPGPAAPRRVVLLSLDGAAAQELHRLERAGRLDGGGFARFFADGEVAGAMVPANPTLTAPSHISLITGHPPAATGIVSNWFHVPGEPPFERANGFAVPIATETLWEAARRAGKRVGALTWPGADDAGPRRRADWGMAYVNTPLRGAQTVVLGREAWTAAAPPPAGVRSFAPPLAAAVELEATKEWPAEKLELVAIDGTDDGRQGYDALLLRQAGWRESEPLGAGEWGLRVREPAAGEAAAASWVKLLALHPELTETRLYLGGAYRGHAYPDDFARRLEAAELWWPGGPDDWALEAALEGKPGIDLATWVEQAERFAAFLFGALRRAAREESWDLLLGYVPVIDEAGHGLLLVEPGQPGYTPALAEQFAAARERVFRAVDRELAGLLAEVDLGTTAVVVVSDHGMAPIHSSVDVASLLVRWDYLRTNPAGEPAAEGTRAFAVTSTALAHVYLHLREREPQGTVGPEEAPALLADLATRFREFAHDGARPIAHVLTRREAGELGMDHPHGGDLVLIAARGFTFHSERRPRADTAVRPAPLLGQHGYLNTDPAMHAIFLALGRGVPRARPERVDALSVAPRVAAWLGIPAPRRAPDP
jgi:predicted AlkP superfamily pyrophosphatase or phosphodiesterase